MNAFLRLDFSLPSALEAHQPPAVRDAVRLLVSQGQEIRHHRFRDLPSLLRPGDLLVVNDSATLPAALGDLHLSTHLGGSRWLVEPRTGHQSVVELPGGGRARLLRRQDRLWEADLELPESWLDYLMRWGKPIRYKYVREEWPLEEYQTVFARHPGSAEMPSAGRPFTARVLADLARNGVEVVSLTLHTGVSSLEHHEAPYPERFRVPAETMDRVRGRQGRLIAVGTTVVRALETALHGERQGWTERVIRPSDRLEVDGLLTGFHEPKASHLDMLTALAGEASVRGAYQTALESGYLWHEFGDVHLLWKAF